MNKYFIYRNSSSDYIIIKKGFVWQAFFFGGLWLFYKKEYIRAISSIFFGFFGITGVVVVTIVLAIQFPENINIDIISALSFSAIFWLLLGRVGNDWLMFSLIGTKYLQVSEIYAINPSDALSRIKEIPHDINDSEVNTGAISKVE